MQDPPPGTSEASDEARRQCVHYFMWRAVVHATLGIAEVVGTCELAAARASLAEPGVSREKCNKFVQGLSQDDQATMSSIVLDSTLASVFGVFNLLDGTWGGYPRAPLPSRHAISVDTFATNEDRRKACATPVSRENLSWVQNCNFLHELFDEEGGNRISLASWWREHEPKGGARTDMQFPPQGTSEASEEVCRYFVRQAMLRGVIHATLETASRLGVRELAAERASLAEPEATREGHRRFVQELSEDDQANVSNILLDSTLASLRGVFELFDGTWGSDPREPRPSRYTISLETFATEEDLWDAAGTPDSREIINWLKDRKTLQELLGEEGGDDMDLANWWREHDPDGGSAH